MKEDVLEVLIYLYENYLIDGAAIGSGQDELTQELSGAGFTRSEIEKAFIWLDDLIKISDQSGSLAQSYIPLRMFTEAEQKRLGTLGQSLLYRLVNASVLDQFTREMVIDRIMALEVEELDEEHIKWVVLMVLSSQGEYEGIFEWAEVFVTEEIMPTIH
jgi:Smg protein